MTNEELFKEKRFNELYEQCEKLIFKICRKYSNVEGKEAKSLCNLGFAKALKSYDIDKGILFSTYLTRCSENEILMFLKKKH